MGLRFAVDTGGTFTDLMVADENGVLSMFKASTTPSDPVAGVIDALVGDLGDVDEALDAVLDLALQEQVASQSAQGNLQQWLGHSSIVVTMRYAHLSQSHGDELIQRLAPKPPGAEAP